MELLVIALAIVTAVVFFAYGKLSALTSSKTVAKIEDYAKYKPYALIAAKRVEEWIDDEMGVSPNASATEKSLHKLDMYLETFINIVTDADGTAPAVAVVDAAKEWSIELAEEMNWKKSEKEAQEALNGVTTGDNPEGTE